ncbi:hypothetical protein Fmac_015047 [Flemingia macrophylla]|uniref:Uncharacterized protein n=1 Tax=Flemingia macrophylla TaxID=520843 RepID=A0ABD1MDH9_9FABA
MPITVEISYNEETIDQMDVSAPSPPRIVDFDKALIEDILLHERGYNSFYGDGGDPLLHPYAWILPVYLDRSKYNRYKSSTSLKDIKYKETSLPHGMTLEGPFSARACREAESQGAVGLLWGKGAVGGGSDSMRKMKHKIEPRAWRKGGSWIWWWSTLYGTFARWVFNSRS